MPNLLSRTEFLLQALILHQEECPHCGSNETPVRARKHVFVRIRRCTQCRLNFTDPIYQPRLTANLYDRLYSAEGSTTRVPDDAELEALEALNFEGSDKDFSLAIDAMMALSSGGHLLEIGSSWGYFLHQARAKGFEAMGVEISTPRREYGVSRLGVDIVSSLEHVAARDFDVIFSAHVLEHFTDLSSIFGHLFNLLKPGGHLVVEVPHFDLDGRGAQALSSVGAVHPIGFTNEFFRLNLPQYGFESPLFYSSWSDAPLGPAPESKGSELRLIARRPER